MIMYVNIGTPRQIAEGKEGEGIDYSILDEKSPEDLTEEEKIALLGRPCLGTNTRIQIRIRESKEFKSSVEKMPSCGDYIMHFLTLPWKIIFAFIPPTALMN